VTPLALGVVTAGHTAGGLAEAAERHPRVVARRVQVGDPADGGIAGLVVDVPPHDRARVVVELARRWRVPLLLEAPVAPSIDGAQAVADVRGGAPIFSCNPLDHHLPTQRLRAQVAAGADPLQSFFAVWRFRPDAYHDGALPQLVDYVGRLSASRPARVTTMRRDRPTVALVSVRYENHVIGSIELGAHLPGALPWRSELLVECFCRDTVYHCASGNQAVTVDGPDRAFVDWSAAPADDMVATFVDALVNGRGPARSVGDDLQVLDVCREILGAVPPA